MKIYHGSKFVIEKPEYHGSDERNDYGPSFYTTLSLDAAKIWACKNDTLGVVNEYEISDKIFKKLKVLDLTDKSKYSVLNWIAILMHFRKLDSRFEAQNKSILMWLQKYYIDVNEYDVVVGFRADDAYFRFPVHFINSSLSIEDLEKVFLTGSLEVQYAFMSKNAVKSLKYKKTIECENEYLGVYFKTVSELTKNINELANQERNPNKTYILDLMRKDHE